MTPGPGAGGEPGGPVAVVTGATRGIGRAVARALGRDGARVVVVGRSARESPDARLPGTVEDAVAELTAAGGEARGVHADLTDPDGTERIVERTLEWFGRCDILVNNAAYTSNGPVLSVPWRRWQTAFRVQVVAPLQLCHGFVPGMLERGAGRVLNVSSGASQALAAGLALYATTKLAMERWTEHMHLELGGRGVAFNTLRVDRIVATEGFRYVLETQGEDTATGGQGLSAVMTPDQAAAHAVWILGRPTDWSGHTVGFDDVTARGGPPTPPR